MSRKRKLLYKIGIGFFIIVGLCTFLSKTIKNMMLPEVEIAKSRSGFLEYSINAIGTVGYGENVRINSEGEWKIKEVLVRPGQAIEANTVLAKVELDNTNEYSEIISPIKGKVNTIYCSANDIAPVGTLLFEVSNNSESYNVTWNSTVEEARYLHINNDILVTFDGVSSTSNVKGKINSKKYVQDGGYYTYEAIIKSSDLKNEILYLGQSVSVNYTFNEGKESSCIIPKEAVKTDGSGNNIVYIVRDRDGVFGTEKYIDPLKVTILASNNIEYSIESIGNDADHIVLNVTESLSSGDEVKIR